MVECPHLCVQLALSSHITFSSPRACPPQIISDNVVPAFFSLGGASVLFLSLGLHGKGLTHKSPEIMDKVKHIIG